METLWTERDRSNFSKTIALIFYTHLTNAAVSKPTTTVTKTTPLRVGTKLQLEWLEKLPNFGNLRKYKLQKAITDA